MAETPTRTVERALSLLGAVCETGRVCLAAAARSAELSPSTALRLLRTLESSGFVRRDAEGDYIPGSRMMQLGARALQAESLVEQCRPEMIELEQVTGESVYLGIRSRSAAVLYIAIVEGSHSVRHVGWVGKEIPLEGSAAGAVLSGNRPADGYVVADRGVEQDVTAIAAPILAAGSVVASLSVLVPSYRTNELRTREIGRLVAESAGRISLSLTGTHLQEQTS